MNPAHAGPIGPLAFAGAVPADPASTQSPHRLATGILFIYLFLVMSRGIEALSAVIGVNLHITMILMITSLVAALFTGGLMKALKTPVVLMFGALTCWLLICTVTSQWRGGSFRTLSAFWVSSFSCVLLLPSLISTLDQCRKVFYVLGFCLVPLLLVTVVFQSHVEGGRDNTLFGTLGNPNDLAFTLLLLIPFAVFLIQTESWMNWKTIVCLLTVSYALLKTLRTGSRAGIITMAACFVVVFLTGPGKTKIKMLGAGLAVVILAFLFVPSRVLMRYTTVFNGTSIEGEMSDDEVSAVQSTRARKMLFEESVRLMVEHPLFGVGPGIFSAALAGEQEKKGENQSWHEAHNSFTQLGSEAGFPAVILFLAAMIYGLKRTISIYRGTKDDPNRVMICRMAGTLAVAMMIYIICAAFGNYAYTFHFPVLAGLIQALDISASKQLKAAPPFVAAPVVLSAPQLPKAAPTVRPRVPIHVRHRRIPDSRV